MPRLLTRTEYRALKAAKADEGTREEKNAAKLGNRIGWERLTHIQYGLVRKDFAYWARDPDWDSADPAEPAG